MNAAMLLSRRRSCAEQSGKDELVALFRQARKRKRLSAFPHGLYGTIGSLFVAAVVVARRPDSFASGGTLDKMKPPWRERLILCRDLQRHTRVPAAHRLLDHEPEYVRAVSRAPGLRRWTSPCGGSRWLSTRAEFPPPRQSD